MPQTDAAEFPATNKLVQDPSIVQKAFAVPKRQFVHRIYREIVANIEDAGPFVALQAINILRSV